MSSTTTFDHNCFYFRLTDKKVVTTKELVFNACYVDLDKDGDPIGIEILHFPMPDGDLG